MASLVIASLVLAALARADYWEERAEFIDNENSQAVGSSLILGDKEKEVNEILMNYKFSEYDEGFRDPQDFLPSVHFFESKARVEQSEVFKFIQKVPKGASLHSHDTALVSFDYLYNLTYRDHLYGCVVDGRLKLHFFGANASNLCDWEPLQTMRRRNSTFDDFIKSELSIIVNDPVKTYPNINVVWARFLGTFLTVSDLVCYKPVFQEYFYHALEELYDDKVMYLEFRGLLPQVYELDGTVYGPEEVVELYVETLEIFKEHHPDFHGARLIYAPSRGVDNKTADEYVATARKLKRLYPDFVAGFDLVGEEDKGKPLRDFIPQLLELAGEMKFFFHAAETDWNGVSTDLNLVDAVLLNTTRIGHGFGIVKHPRVLRSVMEKEIAVELNPISNQVLKLVDDLRNHPGAFLIAGGYPVVVCCDDPSFWGAKALSYDWYMAFMGLASRESDLRLLKQLAINSIKYSAMDDVEKQTALGQWQKQWDEFIDATLASFKLHRYYNFYSVNKVK